MLYGILLTTFLKSIKGKKEKDGERVYNNDLVLTPSVNHKDNNVIIEGRVISENLYNEYNTKIFINTKGELYSSPYCTCNDFEKGNLKYNFYACKHINAQFLYFLNMIQKDETLYNLFKSSEDKNSMKESNLDILEMLAPREKKDEIKFEVYINKRDFDRSIYVYFKLGTKNMKSNSLYTLKDIDAFLTYIHNNIPLKYGKDYTLDLKTQYFKGESLHILNFIKEIKNLDSNNSFKRSQDKYIQGKNMFIPKPMVRNFLQSLQSVRIYLEEGFFYRPVESEVIIEDIPLPFSIKEGKDELYLQIQGSLPKEINENQDGFIYNGSIYLPSFDQIERLSPYIKLYNETNGITFPKSDEARVLKRIIPSIQKISCDLILSNSLKERVVIVKPLFKFYFDKDKEIKLTFKVVYSGYEFNYFHDYKDKIIFRDKKAEGKVYATLRDLGFVEHNNEFIFYKDDDYIFSFFLDDISELQNIGEVYYSETFKGIKSLNTNNFNIHVRKGKHNYFNFEFDIDRLSDNEFRKILRAFRDNKKYYKLESGEFINLEDIELKKLLILLNNSTNDDVNNLYMDLNKAPYFSEYVDKYNLNYFSGLPALKQVRKTLSEYKDIEILIPQELNATLRDYQVQGVKWLTIIKECGYGGILADEMGLGKTLQVIAFLLSQKLATSLVIAPTSLIYNWECEFNKFAPTLKIAVLHDDKEKREEIINNYKDYDVLITTYNLVRRDKSIYDQCYFENIIIDEAQNIKNSSSQNSEIIKSLSSKSRFALTGTPLENSLMELWSIFDYIMPEYLYDRKTFETRYFRRLDEEEVILKEVKALINPFILRRTKKNVIRELPDKIEKKVILKMSNEQIKAYGAYSSYIKELIQKKVHDQEFSQSKIEILSYITKLRQLALDPSLVMDTYEGGSGKLEGLINILKECIDGGHKILLFSQFTSALKKISNNLADNNISYYYLDGSTQSKRRMELVNKFNVDDTNVFLISLKAGGAGLNLTSADVVIHLDPWWNPAVEDQATDRAHRIGQENVVEVIKLISKDSIEEKVIALQDKKKEIIEMVLEDNNFDTISSNLTEDDILSLF